MSLARVAGALALLVTLGGCTGGDEDGAGPQLPDIALPSTTVGVAFEQTLTATGGTAPLRYSITNLPPGFSFYTDTGRLAGPATEAGEWSIGVGVRDAKGQESTHVYALRAWAAPQVTTPGLPAATVGSEYLYTLNAAGGADPLVWSLAEGTLPSGLSLSPDGALHGIPQGQDGAFSLTVRVEDAHGARAEARLGLELRAPGGQTDGGGTDGGTVDAGPPPAVFPLKVGNWNIEWFGDSTPGNGPSNEDLQLANATAVIADAGADVWGLGEIVDTTRFNTLKANLPGYDGFLANDLKVSGGTSSYTVAEQKLGILFKADAVQALQSSIILANHDYDFAGRPPLRVDLRVTRGSAHVDLTVIVMHLKALTTPDDYERRQAAAGWLKEYLDAELPTQNVLVLGDWNDDVDASTTRGDGGTYLPSPFLNLLNDSARYTFLTRALSLSGVGSTAGRTTFIDHQMASNELAASYVQDSAFVLRPAISSYSSTTSDHYPVLSRFDFGSVTAPRTVRITAPNGGETLTAGSTYDITWSATGVNQVRVRYSVDDGVTWRDLATAVSAASGHYTWTVPDEATIRPRVMVVDTERADVTDASDAPFTLSRPTPKVFINEFLPQPARTTGTNADFDKQFVEIVNTGTTAADISGWTLHDSKSYSGEEPTRHTFPTGTTVAPGKAYVVYSGTTALPGGTTSTATVANGGDGLRFNRGVNDGSSGDSVYLVRKDGTVQDLFAYRDTYSDVSYNRSPDASGSGTWDLHSNVSSSLSQSPGTRANGAAY